MIMGHFRSFFGIFHETCILFKFCRSVKVNMTLGGGKAILLGVFLSQTSMSTAMICDFKVIKYSSIHGTLIAFFLIRIDRV